MYLGAPRCSGCRTWVIHNSARSPPCSQGRAWLGRAVTYKLSTHGFFPREPGSGREWKVAACLSVPWARILQVARAIIQSGDLPSALAHSHNPPLGQRFPASSFFFPNATGADHPFVLYKALLAQALAQKCQGLRFTPLSP